MSPNFVGQKLTIGHSGTVIIIIIFTNGHIFLYIGNIYNVLCILYVCGSNRLCLG